jgi:hypothetical protein
MNWLLLVIIVFGLLDLPVFAEEPDNAAKIGATFNQVDSILGKTQGTATSQGTAPNDAFIPDLNPLNDNSGSDDSRSLKRKGLAAIRLKEGLEGVRSKKLRLNTNRSLEDQIPLAELNCNDYDCAR